MAKRSLWIITILQIVGYDEDSELPVYVALDQGAGSETFWDDKLPNEVSSGNMALLYSTLISTVSDPNYPDGTAKFTPDDTSLTAHGVVNILTTGTTGGPHGGQVLGDGDKKISQNLNVTSTTAGSDFDSLVNHAGLTASIIKWTGGRDSSFMPDINTVTCQAFTPTDTGHGGTPGQVGLRFTNVSATGGTSPNDYAYDTALGGAITLYPYNDGQASSIGFIGQTGSGSDCIANVSAVASGITGVGAWINIGATNSAAAIGGPQPAGLAVGTATCMLSTNDDGAGGGTNFVGTTGVSDAPVYAVYHSGGPKFGVYGNLGTATISGGIVTNIDPTFTGDIVVATGASFDADAMTVTVATATISVLNGAITGVA